MLTHTLRSSIVQVFNSVIFCCTQGGKLSTVCGKSVWAKSEANKITSEGLFPFLPANSTGHGCGELRLQRGGHPRRSLWFHQKRCSVPEAALCCVPRRIHAWCIFDGSPIKLQRADQARHEVRHPLQSPDCISTTNTIRTDKKRKPPNNKAD